MHVKARGMAVSGLFLALTELCMALGSVIETNTLFLLAAASYFVGIIIREFGTKAGTAFLISAVLLGFFLAPNKLYVITFGAMGIYLLGTELIWRALSRKEPGIDKKAIFLLGKYGLFNLMFLPGVILFREVLFPEAVSDLVFAGTILAGQVLLYVYDRAYDYVQVNLWGRVRGRILEKQE